jgi:LmbE family N-acetylglucosaminyl deacetylase
VLSTAPSLWEPVRPFTRALVVVAHPDDAEFGAGGTVARLTAMGTDVRYLVLTDGASGSSDPTMTRERLAGLREDEQRAACAELGVQHVELLGHPDGFLEASVERRREVAAEIRRQRPELVITLNPEMRWSSWGYINHPDHRAVGDLVLHSINPAASTRLYDLSLIEEGLEPWDVSELWLTGFGDGFDLVDISDSFDRKIAALRCHETQLAGWDPAPRMRQLAAARGAEVGVSLAEAFTMLRFRILTEDGSRPARDQPATQGQS